MWQQVRIIKVNPYWHGDDVLQRVRCASFLAYPAAVLVRALLRNHETADQAHDQAPLHPVHLWEKGTEDEGTGEALGCRIWWYA